MTIGRPLGAVWIGKPLDVSIPLSLDGTEADGALCLEADVLQGESLLPERRVSVSYEPGAARIRVRSTVPVEEPVVSLTVRAGCALKSSRNYVLLADVPVATVPPALPAERRSEAAAGVAPAAAVRPAAPTANGEGGAAEESAPAAAAPPRRSNPSPAPAQAAAEAPAPARRRAAADTPAPVRRAAAPAPVPAAPAARPSPVAASAEGRARESAGPRLRLEALEPAPSGGLRTSPELHLPDAPDLARRAAAAALWSALDPAAAEQPRDTQRVKDMESALAALREQAAQNQRSLIGMRSELAQARESRYANPLVFGLLALLLLALIGMLVLWRLARRASAPAWWGEARAAGEEVRRPQPQDRWLDDDMDPDSEPPAHGRKRVPRSFGPTPFAPLDGHQDDDEAAESPAPLPQPAPWTDSAPVRPLNTEELFDVQQQSDFFLSLGQHDQAIAVLREHIAANPGTSALAYLDLLRIFHSLERREDYAQLAEAFERAFNADVPAFEHFSEVGRGLEHYPGPLARIEALWPAPATLGLIEELVFRRTASRADGAFDLAAYRELLLLHSIAKEVIDPASAAAPPFQPTTRADTLYEGPPTATAPLDTRVPPPATGVPATPLPAIDHGAEPGLAAGALREPAADNSIEMDLDAFDVTAYETLPAPIEPPKPAAPASDPHVIDFDLFDPGTEAEIAPRPIIKR